MSQSLTIQKQAVDWREKNLQAFGVDLSFVDVPERKRTKRVHSVDILNKTKHLAKKFKRTRNHYFEHFDFEPSGYFKSIEDYGIQ